MTELEEYKALIRKKLEESYSSGDRLRGDVNWFLRSIDAAPKTWWQERNWSEGDILRKKGFVLIAVKQRNQWVCSNCDGVDTFETIDEVMAWFDKKLPGSASAPRAEWVVTNWSDLKDDGR